jgi:hypothetical protein
MKYFLIILGSAAAGAIAYHKLGDYAYGKIEEYAFRLALKD